LEKRFSVGSRYVLSIVSLITFVVSKIAVGIFAGGVVFSVLLPELHFILPGGLDLDSFWIGSVLVIVLTGLYTVLGGMRAVAYNDAVQTIVLICGSATLTIYGLWKLGSGSLLHGWTQLHATCQTQDMFNLWKPLLPEGVQGTWAPVLETSDGHVVREAWYFNSHFPWLGMAICAPVIGLWYWCTDQYIVQRALGAPNEKTARRGSIFAAVLKLFPVYLFIVPGLICYALSKNYIEPKLTGATTFEAADFKYKEKEFLALAAKLSQPQDEASRFVAVELAKLSPDAYKQLAGVNDPKNSYADLRGELAKGFNTLISCTDLRVASVDELNKIIEAGSIDDKRRFPEAMLSEETKRLRGRKAPNLENATREQKELSAFLTLRLNRMLLEDAFPKEIDIDRMIDRDGKGNQRNCQAAFPLMVKELLPEGLRGLVVAGLLSALMGSLAGVFNACSTLFTVDLYEKWKPKATQQQIVRTGRIATTVMVLIALAWIPVVKGANSLYEYLQQIQGYLAPPIFVVFFFGVFFKRLNAKGCWWAMVVGFIMGVFRMLVDTPVTMKVAGFENGYTEGSTLWIINKINFQYFSILITLVSAVVMIVVSYMTSPPPAAQIRSLTFGTATADDKRKTRASWDWREVAASAFVLAAILGAYLYFRG
jgi:uncharacterized sodium:solute symporter family permease YidK